MKPAAFEYLRPHTTGEALALLKQHHADAKVLAGGQSLVPMLNFRLARFRYLIDINRVAELSYIRLAGDVLQIGATTRYRAIENSELVQANAPLLATATRSVAHLPVRSRGTIGGSLAHADPAAEYPAVLVALGGCVVARKDGAEREIAADDLVKGIFTTALDPDELITEVRLPVARPDQAFGFEEFTRRPGDLAIAGVAACLDFAGAKVAQARLVAFGVEGAPLRISEAEELLPGDPLTSQRIETAMQAASRIPAQADIHATGNLRSHLIGVLTARVLRRIAASRGGAA